MLKKERGRMRFIGSPNIELRSEYWLSEIFEFKTFIRANTQYQFIDNKIYWHCKNDLSECMPFFAVLGAPMEIERQIKVIDFEAGPYWVEQLDFEYDFDFATLKSKMGPILEQIPRELDKMFHLVMDGEKIELHFFLQKDYIG